jgi:3-hydroxyisobutyrate dehydrogenase-like beta-hydroxyacid dehydrogenase
MPTAAGPVGLVGIGLVGSALAEHLLARGFAVVGCDLDADRRAWLESRGGQAVAAPAAVAEHSCRVVLSLPTTAAVIAVAEGPRGLLAAPRPPRTVIDTTTGDPEETERLALRLAARGVQFIEATISGSSRQVRDRQALFLTAGDREAVTQAADLLDALTDRRLYLGPSGSASRAKLASNLVLGLNRLALAEGLAFAECLGLDLAAFLEVLRASPAYSAAVDTKGARMVAGDFAPESRVRQHRKDLQLILDYASRCGQELPLAGVHAEVLDRLADHGDGDLDTSAVIRELRRRRRGGPGCTPA